MNPQLNIPPSVNMFCGGASGPHCQSKVLPRVSILVVIVPPPIGERSIVMSVSVCLCACLSVLEHIFRTTRPILTKFLRMLPMAVVRFACGGVLIRYVLPVLWITPYIFARKPRLLDVAAQLERSARVALGLAINLSLIHI